MRTCRSLRSGIFLSSSAIAPRLRAVAVFANASLAVFLWGGAANDQIVPDGTLPQPSAVMQIPAGDIFQIDGGSQAGANLFHSFSEFSVPTGAEAFFNNAPIVENIFSRVTGNRISNIDGLLRANGTANLFLINPNGIVFGPNARLDIGGSFLGSTAESILFDSGEEFSAIQTDSIPLLTVTVPAGLQLGVNPGDIQANGTGHGFIEPDPTFSPVARGDRNAGLEVAPGRTLALLGGNVSLRGGTLTAERGRVEVGATADITVALSSVAEGFRLDYEGAGQFRDVRFSQQSAADASGTGAGTVRVVGNDVAFTDGSLALVQTQGNENGGSAIVRAAGMLEIVGATPEPAIALPSGITSETLGEGRAASVEVTADRLAILDGGRIGSRTFGEGDSGMIRVAVTELAELRGIFPNVNVFSSIASIALGSGNSGSVSVSARNLRLADGANVTAITFGTGRGGEVTANVVESLEAIGVSPLNPEIVSGITSTSLGPGDSGSVRVSARNLRLTDGAQINAGTFVSGRGGDVTVDVAESLEAVGVSSLNTDASSSINSSSLGSGNGGSVRVSARNLYLANGGNVNAATLGSGRGGNVTVNVVESFEAVGLSPFNPDLAAGINSASLGPGDGGSVAIATQKLILRDGASVFTNAFGTGNAGTVVVSASESIEVSGETPNFDRFSAIQSAATTASEASRQRLGLFLPSGDSGDVTVATPRLRVANGGRVSALNEGPGRGGTVRIDAGEVALLDSNAGITASTTSGEGGNIFLTADSLQLTNQSQIAAEAGGTGNGGNITIDAKTIALIENSNITANAVEGSGGNIAIATQGTFFSPESSVTASSQFGVDGIIEITNPDIDTDAGLADLSGEVPDPEDRVSTACSADEGSSFTRTGRGGLPDDPAQPLLDRALWQDWQNYPEDRDATIVAKPISSLEDVSTQSSPQEIVSPPIEATTWTMTADGTVALLAEEARSPDFKNPSSCGSHVSQR